MQKRYFGWKPQKPDFRDRQFAVPSMLAELPRAIDLRDYCPEVYDQGALGSCTANAIGFLCEFDWIKQNKADPYTPSRLFIYYNEREMEGTVDEDAGAEIRDGIKSLNKFGFCREDLWPYEIESFAIKPSNESYIAAKKEIVKEYGVVQQNLRSMKAAIASGFPIVIGFSVYDSFMSEEVSSTGIVPMPKEDESIVGGHAVAIVGYDEDGWIVRNSWGSEWGLKGYFKMPFEYLTNSDLASDLWCVRFVP